MPDIFECYEKMPSEGVGTVSSLTRSKPVHAEDMKLLAQSNENSVRSVPSPQVGKKV